MISYSQDKGVPKFLMEFSRNEEIPKLVSINEVTHKQNRNRLLQQARIQSTHQTRKGNDPDLTSLRQNLEGQRNENQQLRRSLKELTRQLSKLKEVNEGLIIRIKQVEVSYKNLKNQYERNTDQQLRKLKNQIYSDVEEYVRNAVQKLTSSLKLEKMTPLLEDKLQRFMAELLQINSVSVEYFSKRKWDQESKKKQSRIQSFERGIQSRNADRYLTQASRTTSKKLEGRQQYASIMQRLTGQNKQGRMSKSYAVGSGGAFSHASQDTRIRTLYAATPQKRRKIFD